MANNMSAAVTVPINLQVLQSSINQFQQVLKNLQPNTAGFKAVQKIINSLIDQTNKLQNQLSKPFTSQLSFNQADKTLANLEESVAKAKTTIESIKFSDIKLTSSQEETFKSLEKNIQSVEQAYLRFREETKQGFFSDSNNKQLVSGINADLLKKDFSEIEAAVDAHIAELKTREAQLEKTYKDLYSQQQKSARARTMTSGEGITRETIGESLFNEYLTDAAGKLAFKSGVDSSAFLKAIEQSFQLDEGALKGLIGKTFEEINSAIQSFGKGENPFQKIIDRYSQTDLSGMENRREQLKKEIGEYKDLQTEMNTVSTGVLAPGMKKFQTQIDSAQEATQKFMNGTVAWVQSSNNVSNSCNQMNSSLSMFRQQLEQTNAQWLNTQRQMSSFNSIRTAITNFMGFTQVLNLTKTAVRNALSHIQELDSVMNKIAIVTDMSTGDLWNQVDSYSKMAQNYGVSIKGAYEVSQIYYQQGLQTADVMTLTNETLKLAKISGLDYAHTTDYMTTALRGFKMEMSEASTIVDVYSNLAAHTAVSQEELAVAMSKTASSMESVGASFQETSAMIGTMVAVTRESATNLGSALKSIASRYGEMKKSSEEVLDADGEAISYNKVDAALQSVGISIKDTEGQFRNFTDVIIELGEKWNELDSIQQRYIATQFAGNRQQSRFLALISNVDLLKSNIDVAENSEDVGTVQTLKSLDSIQSKMNQLQVAYQQFYTTIGAEGAWKTLIDGATEVINTLNSLPKLFGKVPVGAVAMVADIITIIRGLGESIIMRFAEIWKTIAASSDGAEVGRIAGQGYIEGVKTSVVAGAKEIKAFWNTLRGQTLDQTRKTKTESVKETTTTQPQATVQPQQGVQLSFGVKEGSKERTIAEVASISQAAQDSAKPVKLDTEIKPFNVIEAQKELQTFKTTPIKQEIKVDEASLAETKQQVASIVDDKKSDVKIDFTKVKEQAQALREQLNDMKSGKIDVNTEEGAKKLQELIEKAQEYKKILEEAKASGNLENVSSNQAYSGTNRQLGNIISGASALQNPTMNQSIEELNALYDRFQKLPSIELQIGDNSIGKLKEDADNLIKKLQEARVQVNSEEAKADLDRLIAQAQTFSDSLGAMPTPQANFSEIKNKLDEIEELESKIKNNDLTPSQDQAAFELIKNNLREVQKLMSETFGEEGPQTAEGKALVDRYNNASEAAGNLANKNGQVTKSYKSLSSAAAGLNMLATFFNNGTRGGEIFSGVLMTVSGGLRAIDAAMTAVSSGNPFGAILTGAMALISIINGISTMIETAEERQERLAKEAEEASNAAKVANADYKNLDNSIKKLDELKEKRYESAEAAEEYQTAVNDLAEKFPALIDGLDQAGNIVITNANAEEVLREAREKSAQATYDATKAEYERIKDEIKTKKDNLKDSNKGTGIAFNDFVSFAQNTEGDEIAQALYNLKEYYQDNKSFASEEGRQALQEFGKILNSGVSSDVYDSESIQLLQEAYQEVINEISLINNLASTEEGVAKQLVANWQNTMNADKQAWVYLNESAGAAAIVTNSITNDILNGGFDVNETNASIMDSRGNYRVSMNNFISSLSDERLKLFNQMFENPDIYTSESFAAEFGNEKGWSPEVANMIERYYSDTVTSIYTRLIKQLNNSLTYIDTEGNTQNKEIVSGSFYDKFQTSIALANSRVEEQLLNNILSQYENLSSSGFVEQAETYGNKALDLFKALDQMELTNPKVYGNLKSVISEYNLNTKEGIDKFIKYIESTETVVDDSLITDLNELRDTLQDNLSLTVKALTQDLVDNWSNKSKTLSSLTSGIDIDQVQSIIDSFGGEIKFEDFKSNGDKLILLEDKAEEVWRLYYDNENAKIATAQQELDNALKGIQVKDNTGKINWDKLSDNIDNIDEKIANYFKTILGDDQFEKFYKSTDNGFVFEEGVTPDKVIDALQDSASNLSKEMSQYSTILQWQLDQLQKTSKWKKGDYSSLQKETGNVIKGFYSILTLLNGGLIDGQDLAEWRKIAPDVGNAADQVKSAYDKMLSDLLSQGIEYVQSQTYEGVNPNAFSNISGSYASLVQTYAKTAGKTITEINTLYMQAVAKDTEATNQDIIKDLRFINRDTFTATADELSSFASKLGLNVADLINNGVANYSKEINEYVVDIRNKTFDDINWDEIENFDKVVSASVNGIFKDIISAVQNGIKGTISLEDIQHLKFNLAEGFGLNNIHLQFTRTAEGYKLAEQSVFEIYTNLKEIDELQARSLLPEISKMSDNYSSVQKACTEYNRLIKLNTKSLQEQKVVLADLIKSMMMSPDSYNFMSGALPDDWQYAKNYLENMEDARTKLLSASKAGYMDAADFYNIVSTAGAYNPNFNLNGMTADQLISAAGGHLTTKNGSMVVDLSAKTGLSLGKNGFSKLYTQLRSGMEAFTQQTEAYFSIGERFSKISEIIKAMEPIDFRKLFMGEGFSAEGTDYLIQLKETADKMPELQSALQDIQIGGTNLYNLISSGKWADFKDAGISQEGLGKLLKGIAEIDWSDTSQYATEISSLFKEANIGKPVTIPIDDYSFIAVQPTGDAITIDLNGNKLRDSVVKAYNRLYKKDIQDGNVEKANGKNITQLLQEAWKNQSEQNPLKMDMTTAYLFGLATNQVTVKQVGGKWIGSYNGQTFVAKDENELAEAIGKAINLSNAGFEYELEEDAEGTTSVVKAQKRLNSQITLKLGDDQYTLYDANGNKIGKEFNSEQDALNYMRQHGYSHETNTAYDIDGATYFIREYNGLNYTKYVDGKGATHWVIDNHDFTDFNAFKDYCHIRDTYQSQGNSTWDEKTKTETIDMGFQAQVKATYAANGVTKEFTIGDMTCESEEDFLAWIKLSSEASATDISKNEDGSVSFMVNMGGTDVTISYDKGGLTYTITLDKNRTVTSPTEEGIKQAIADFKLKGGDYESSNGKPVSYTLHVGEAQVNVVYEEGKEPKIDGDKSLLGDKWESNPQKPIELEDVSVPVEIPVSTVTLKLADGGTITLSQGEDGTITLTENIANASGNAETLTVKGATTKELAAELLEKADTESVVKLVTAAAQALGITEATSTTWDGEKNPSIENLVADGIATILNLDQGEGFKSDFTKLLNTDGGVTLEGLLSAYATVGLLNLNKGSTYLVNALELLTNGGIKLGDNIPGSVALSTLKILSGKPNVTAADGGAYVVDIPSAEATVGEITGITLKPITVEDEDGEIQVTGVEATVTDADGTPYTIQIYGEFGGWAEGQLNEKGQPNIEALSAFVQTFIDDPSWNNLVKDVESRELKKKVIVEQTTQPPDENDVEEFRTSLYGQRNERGHDLKQDLLSNEQITGWNSPSIVKDSDLDNYIQKLESALEMGQTLSQIDITNLENLSKVSFDKDTADRINSILTKNDIKTEDLKAQVQNLIALSEVDFAGVDSLNTSLSSLNLTLQLLNGIDLTQIISTINSLKEALSSGDTNGSLNLNITFSDADKANIESSFKDLLETITQVIPLTLDVSDAPGKIGTIQNAINNLKDKTVYVEVKETAGSAKGNVKTPSRITSKFNKFGPNAIKGPLAKGNVALAGGTPTLMGELGPELWVSNGHYYVAGQGGAEFVNLPDDAIVFNHLQTKNLLTNGRSSRGKVVTNEQKAVALAHGSFSGGPARETRVNSTEELGGTSGSGATKLEAVLTSDQKSKLASLLSEALSDGFDNIDWSEYKKDLASILSDVQANAEGKYLNFIYRYADLTGKTTDEINELYFQAYQKDLGTASESFTNALEGLTFYADNSIGGSESDWRTILQQYDISVYQLFKDNILSYDSARKTYIVNDANKLAELGVKFEELTGYSNNYFDDLATTIDEIGEGLSNAVEGSISRTELNELQAKLKTIGINIDLTKDLINTVGGVGLKFSTMGTILGSLDESVANGSISQDDYDELSAGIKDAIFDYASNLSEMVANGIEGSLSYSDVNAFKDILEFYDINLDLTFTRTREGLKLSVESAAELYDALKGVDEVAAELTLNSLVESLGEANDDYKTMSSLLAHIQELTQKVQDTSHYSTEKIAQYQKELDLAKQIAEVRATTDDESMNWFDDALPSGFNNPLDYVGSFKSAIEAMRQWKTDGVTDFQNLYNMANQINVMAKQTGTALDFLGYSLDGTAESMTALITAAGNALGTVNVNGTNTFGVVLKEMGVDLTDGATSYENSAETAIHAMAEAQIKILDGLINMLEVIVAMEDLSEVDVNGDSILDWDELIVVDEAGIQHFTERMQENIDKWTAALDSTSESYNADMATAFNNFVVNGQSIAQIITKSAEEWTEQDAQIISAIYQIWADNPDIDWEDITTWRPDAIAKLEEIFKDSGGLTYSFDGGTTTVSVRNDIEYTMDEEGHYVYNGKTYDTWPEVLLAKLKADNVQTSTIEGWDMQGTVKVGQKQFTVLANESGTEYYSEVTGGTYKNLNDLIKAEYEVSGSSLSLEAWKIEQGIEVTQKVTEVKVNNISDAQANALVGKTYDQLQKEWTEAQQNGTTLEFQAKYGLIPEENAEESFNKLKEDLGIKEDKVELYLALMNIDEIAAQLTEIFGKVGNINLGLGSTEDSNMSIGADNTAALEAVAAVQTAVEELKGALEELNQTAIEIDTSATITSLGDIVEKGDKAADSIKNVGLEGSTASTLLSSMNTQLSQISGWLSTLSTKKFTFQAEGKETLDTVAEAVKTLATNIQSLKDLEVEGVINLNMKIEGVGGATGNVIPGEANAAGSRQVLMGELGPELYVTGGRYYVAGQGGAEFVNLPKDAIVFNHLQTQKLLSTGAAGRGKPVTNEKQAVSFATGNITGLAMASAKETLEKLKQLRAMWQSLASSSLSELVGLATSKDDSKSSDGSSSAQQKAWLETLEKWYNWLQKIAEMEKIITIEQAKRNKISSDRDSDGKAYYASQRRELAALKQQYAAQKSLTESQKAYYAQRRKELEASPFGWLYGFDEMGQIFYKGTQTTIGNAPINIGYGSGNPLKKQTETYDGGLRKTNGYNEAEEPTFTEATTQLYIPEGTSAFEFLTQLWRTNPATGQPLYSPQQQYEALSSMGFAEYMRYDENGNQVTGEGDEFYTASLEAFYNKIDADRQEAQGLFDSITEGESKLYELQQKQNEILSSIRDNQIDTENKLLNAIEAREQAVIDELQNTRDALDDSAQKYLDGLRTALDNERNMYNNQQSSADLERLRRQLSILQRSGGSASAIASLQKEIDSKSQEAYFAEQEASLQALEDASNLQIERLDQQIDLMTESLTYAKEHGLLWTEIDGIMQKSSAEIASFILKYDSDYQAQNITEQEKTRDSIEFMTEQWVAFRDDPNKYASIQESFTMNAEEQVPVIQDLTKIETTLTNIDATLTQQSSAINTMTAVNAAALTGNISKNVSTGSNNNPRLIGTSGRSVAGNVGGQRYAGTTSSSSGSNTGGLLAVSNNTQYKPNSLARGAALDYDPDYDRYYTYNRSMTYGGLYGQYINDMYGYSAGGDHELPSVVNENAYVEAWLQSTASIAGIDLEQAREDLTAAIAYMEMHADQNTTDYWNYLVDRDKAYGNWLDSVLEKLEPFKDNPDAMTPFGMSVADAIAQFSRWKEDNEAVQAEHEAGLHGKETYDAAKLERQNELYIELGSPKNLAELEQRLKEEGYIYSKGGSVEHTGLAMVHGTPNHPEYFLDAEETQMWKHDILGNNNSSLSSLLLGFRENLAETQSLYNNVNSVDNGTNIENVEVHLHIDSLADSYDARSAAQDVLDELMQISRKAGANGIRR